MKSLHRKIPSAFEHLERIVEETQAFMGKVTDDDELAYRVTLLASEAVTNAMEHGNGLDASKHVVVHLQAYEDRIELSVEDEGRGFEASDVVDPLSNDHLLDEGGRGIFLMKQMADEVHREADGRRMRLVFKRP